jgi:hypothetical protein
MYGGMCTGHYTQSLLMTGSAFTQAGIQMSAMMMFNESLIQRARNGLVKNFLRTDGDYLMFIDADIGWNPHDIMPMIDADKDIICGIYPKKEINWHGVKAAVEAGVPVEQLKHHSGALVVNLVDYSGTVTVPRKDPLEIWNGGTGFMLIKRSVFEGLKDKVATYTNDVVDLNNSVNPGDLIHEFFAVSIEEGTNRLLSEDYHFCMLARKHGYKVWAAPWVSLGHVGSYLFEGTLIPAA